MRILVLANLDVGLYKFRKELIEELLKQNHEIYISLPNGTLVRPFEKMGCVFIDTPIDRRGINPKTDFKLLLKYRKMFRDVNPELVITYTIKPNIYGGIVARFAKKKYAVNITGLGTAFETPGFVRFIAITLYKIALKNAKVIFFENSSNRDEMVALGCCNEEKTIVLNGAGVNTETYRYQSYPNNDRMKFLFVGRVMKEKGIDEIFASMKRLMEEGYKCFLDVVGPCEEDYRDRLEIYEKAGWLKYHGYQEDVRPFIAACDCFVLPSYHEGMANTNLECAASGRPIITSDIPGCREAVAENTGFLCEARNVESIYVNMKKMMDLSRNERESMGRKGRKHMVDVFDKKAVIKETIKYLT